MAFEFCKIVFSKNIIIKSNFCNQIIGISSKQETAYIQIMEYSNITFIQNNYSDLIVVKLDPPYTNPHPFCLFQYLSLPSTSKVSPSHYKINISDSFLYKCKWSFHQFTSHCQWIPNAAFHDHDPSYINQQIIHVDYQLYPTTIFHCSNISIDNLGPVYPGQKLQVELCVPCSKNFSILYTETYNTHLPKSACKIAHQSELTGKYFC